MSEKILNAELRTEKGKNSNRKLRDKGFIPAVIYSHGEAESLKISEKDFTNLFKGHISESIIFNLNITNKKEDSELMAFVKNYQLNAITDKVIHLDLFKVTKGEKIHTVVPLEIIGSAAGVRVGGILEISEREVEVECLPKDLPEKLVVDVSELEIGQYIHAKDIDHEDSVKLLSNPDSVIAAVHTPKAIEEEEAEELIEEEGEAEEKADSDEEAEE